MKNTPIQIHRLLIILLLTVSAISNGWSQLTTVPHYASRAVKNKKNNLRTTGTTLTLPFLDDFASTKKTDTVWQKNVGVHINSTLGIDPPTLGVASFDGVNGSGVPYDISVSTNQGGADTLVSCPIDLSGKTAADNIYLSFYWQAKGLGELPDSDDSLKLEFKDVNGDWVSVWSQMGGDSLTKFAPADYTLKFKQEIFAVTNTNYLHAGFQFRFISFARISGSYDNWNLDYVYLDANRHINNFGQQDVVLDKVPGSFLKNYQAMPFNQYLANAANETNADITTRVTNLNTAGFTLLNYDCTLEESTSGTFISTLLNVVPAPLLSAGASQDIVANINPTLLDAFKNNSGVTLKYSFRSYLQASNRNDIDQNDTISRTTVLTDYYAYDDGSAEFLAGVNQNRGQVAYRYVLNEPDTLTDVQMYVARLNKDLTGQTFIFKVWNSKNGKPDSVLLQKSVVVANMYASAINEFKSISAALDSAADKFVSVVLQDTVFIGWQQTTDDMLTVGLDKNTESSDKIYSNLAGEWIQNTDTLGSLMIRPVFGTVGVVGLPEPGTGSGSKLNPALVNVYPNPNQHGKLHIEGLSLQHIRMLTLQGQVVKTVLLQQNGSKKYEIDINDLPTGTYLLHCIDAQGRGLTKRVVILK